jgi:hypothetical protein
MTSCPSWNAGNASANSTGYAAPANGPKKRASKAPGSRRLRPGAIAAACADFPIPRSHGLPNQNIPVLPACFYPASVTREAILPQSSGQYWEFVQVEQMLLPKKCRMVDKMLFDDGNHLIRHYEGECTKIDLHPVLDRGAFVPLLENGATLANQQNLQHPYRWRGGKPVPKDALPVEE